MKEMIKLVVTHFFIITVSMMFVICAANTVVGVKEYPAYFPWQIMFTGFLTALPSFMFYFKEEPSKKQFLFRTAIHFILIEFIVLIEGKLVGWYSTPGYALIMFFMIAFVYIIVFLYSYFVLKGTADSINKALEEYNSDEEK